MLKSKFFQVCYGIILVFVIIWLGTKIDFIFKPFFVLIETLFLPLLIAGIFYYLFRPIVGYLEQRKIPRVLAILIIYLSLGLMLTIIIIVLTPLIQEQVTSLINSIPRFAVIVEDSFQELVRNKWVIRFQESANVEISDILNPALNHVQNFLTGITTNISGFINVITNFVMLLVTAPLVLFYMLKEGEKLPNNIVRFLPKKNRKDGLDILANMNKTLGTYIQGQILVSILVGVMLLIGYLIIGIDYALLLALVAMFTNIIPYLGAIIAGAPAVFVAFTDSPAMIVKVLIVMVVAQQIEGNFVSPYIMGKNLEIHPITIVFLILVAGSLYGVLGIILAVPGYAVGKVLVTNIYRLIQLRKVE